jgi:iron complex transport system substrate-binding protein
VIALGEEFLLADLLAVGVVPVASTATVAEEGFVGIDAELTEGIEPLPGTEPNIERLAALRPEVIVATPFVVDEVGEEVLSGLGELVVVDTDDPRESVLELGRAFDRSEEARRLVDDYEAAVTDGRSALPQGTEVTVATVYPGPSLAVWVEGPSTIPATLEDLGVTLTPSVDEVDATGGRAYISSERLDLLSAPTLVLLQSSLVDGEASALAEVAEDPRWSRLPAVAADRVIELDRLAYPGISGRTQAVDDLVRELAPE